MGKIDSFIARRIKDTAGVVDVLMELGVQLVRKGPEWEGLCPFHDDRHVGSFKVSDAKNLYQCFACGAHGHAVDAVMELGGKSYPEALRWLGAMYGIQVDDEPVPMVKKLPPRRVLPRKQAMVWPIELAKRSLDQSGNVLLGWMRGVLNEAQQERLKQMSVMYLVGTGRAGDVKGWTIWWQVNEKQQVCRGHVMKYGADGHRDKESEYNNTWVHSLLAKSGHFDRQKYETVSCLFGLHLMDYFPDAEVVLVESEKTALFCSCVSNPKERLFMATCGMGNLTREKLGPLIERGRRVVLLPDHDGRVKWKERMEQIGYERMMMSDELERMWLPQMGEKADIMDALLFRLEHRVTVSDEAHRLMGLTEENENLTNFINQLNLELV